MSKPLMQTALEIMGDIEEDRSLKCRYRLWDVQEQTILEASDDMMDILAVIYEMECTIRGIPFASGHILQVLRKDEVTQTFNVLFTCIRGPA